MTNKRLVRTILVITVCIGIVLGAGYAVLRRIKSNVCISEEMMTIPDVAGAKVEVVYTNCDTLAKEEDISVFFSRVAVKPESWFARWRNRKERVVSYDPGGRAFPDMPLPTITHPSPTTILISVPEDSYILYRSRKWENISIDLALGKFYYPANTQ